MPYQWTPRRACMSNACSWNVTANILSKQKKWLGQLVVPILALIYNKDPAWQENSEQLVKRSALVKRKCYETPSTEHLWVSVIQWRRFTRVSVIRMALCYDVTCHNKTLTFTCRSTSCDFPPSFCVLSSTVLLCDKPSTAQLTPLTHDTSITDWTSTAQ